MGAKREYKRPSSYSLKSDGQSGKAFPRHKLINNWSFCLLEQAMNFSALALTLPVKGLDLFARKLVH